jgi:16S rRNA (uracil1498-N3)-methyltransferase
MRRFHADIDTPKNTATLGSEETRHLRDVLRLRTGETVAVFDGRGNEFSARIGSILKNATQLDILAEIEPSAAESNLDLTLAVALLKSDKFDLVVQKAVELGVSRIVPLLTVRADVKPKDPTKRADRWRKIALEASKQCGRARLTTIDEPVEFADFCASDRAGATAVLFSERSGAGFGQIDLKPTKLIAISGPEGGWDDSEIELARASGILIVTLGGRILRAETAAIAIASILQHNFGDLN